MLLILFTKSFANSKRELYEKNFGQGIMALVPIKMKDHYQKLKLTMFYSLNIFILSISLFVGKFHSMGYFYNARGERIISFQMRQIISVLVIFLTTLGFEPIFQGSEL